jgi:hypothetical protein
MKPLFLSAIVNIYHYVLNYNVKIFIKSNNFILDDGSIYKWEIYNDRWILHEGSVNGE